MQDKISAADNNIMSRFSPATLAAEELLRAALSAAARKYGDAVPQSVEARIMSEYQAIKDAGLHQTVTLDTVNWSGYDKNQLSILEVVLQRYQDPSGLT